jgi:hypothetical protein
MNARLFNAKAVSLNRRFLETTRGRSAEGKIRWSLKAFVPHLESRLEGGLDSARARATLRHLIEVVT